MNYQTTDFLNMHLDDIRGRVNAAVGDDEFPEDVEESMIHKLKTRSNVTPEEFWTVFDETFAEYEDQKGATT